MAPLTRSRPSEPCRTEPWCFTPSIRTSRRSPISPRRTASQCLSVRISFNAMMLEMAAEKLWNDTHRLDHLTVGLGHSDAVAALSAGYGSATVTAHIGVQPFTDRGLKLPGARVVADSREVFGGPLTQVTLLATKQIRDKDPTLFKADRQRAGAIDQAMQCGQARCRGALEKGSERVRKRRRVVCPAWRSGLRVHVTAASHRPLRGVSQPHRHHEVEGRRLEGAVLGNRL
jgi:hypothetical protein